jgi:hypothetical protein
LFRSSREVDAIVMTERRFGIGTEQDDADS